MLTLELAMMGAVGIQPVLDLIVLDRIAPGA
jgi:hypothetical protein